MRLFVRYNQAGTITSATKVEIILQDLEHPYTDVSENETVLEIQPTPELEALACYEICDRYVMDVNSKEIKLKS